METESAKPTIDKAQSNSETPHKHAVTAVTTIAGCAFGTFALGAVVNQAWPAAVASCGLSMMGVGVAFVLLRRA
ncbi:MAG TPA: hypothetical protein VG938_12835 [Verrucomicrobiae bacterium]|nr:hypothetical protein [Verrucomicrobiae bacterium]